MNALSATNIHFPKARIVLGETDPYHEDWDCFILIRSGYRNGSVSAREYLVLEKRIRFYNHFDIINVYLVTKLVEMLQDNIDYPHFLVLLQCFLTGSEKHIF